MKASINAIIFNTIEDLLNKPNIKQSYKYVKESPLTSKLEDLTSDSSEK